MDTYEHSAFVVDSFEALTQDTPHLFSMINLLLILSLGLQGQFHCFIFGKIFLFFLSFIFPRTSFAFEFFFLFQMQGKTQKIFVPIFFSYLLEYWSIRYFVQKIHLKTPILWSSSNSSTHLRVCRGSRE